MSDARIRESCQVGLYNEGIDVARGSRGAWPPKKILEHIIILWLEMRYPKQNSIIRLKSNILAP